MNKLLYICIFLLIVPFIGRQYYPEIFGVTYIQLPAIIMLMLLLPIGFAKALSIYFKTDIKSLKLIFRPIAFLLLFCVLLLMHLPANYVVTTLFAVGPNYVLDNSDLDILEGISKADTVDKRKLFAKIVFENSGDIVPYKLDSGEYAMYEPTELDRKEYERNRKAKELNKTYKEFIVNASLQSIYLQAAELISFLLIFTITLIIEQKSFIWPKQSKSE